MLCIQKHDEIKIELLTALFQNLKFPSVVVVILLPTFLVTALLGSQVAPKILAAHANIETCTDPKDLIMGFLDEQVLMDHCLDIWKSC